ncbi:hypothetical protein FIV42_05840 [Persicimonas caeni]|uniref:Fibronectin type-III domain-containing protein n=1 Tax=Persicimonas caeni TaxID=2292766 RepID=A0A4Y6PPM4_PERCE|nr:MYXO-CTERM sorting domain-containing protein [Persicimonas caeni]QDG50268.1 hypothetical protein FIV42_05840 [Persicimonas caeni]QED31489.1 hypothetical protein FRD00_05835 [Persicimonas caeni]
MCGPFGCPPKTGVKPCWICLLIVILGMIIPQFADADPGLPPRPTSTEANLSAHGHVGEDLSPELLERAKRVYRAKKLRQRPHYTAVPGDGALSGLRIGLSGGHGIMWYSDRSTWSFQRGVTEGLREDIHTNQTMIDFLIDMVERSGGTAVTMRERNYGTAEVVVDNDEGTGYVEASGTWDTGSSEGFGSTYRYAYLDPNGSAEARWEFSVPEDGEYPVYAYFLASNNRTEAAEYTVEHVGGQTTRTLNQSELLVEDWERADYPNIPPGADAARTLNDVWHYVGTFPFEANKTYAISLSNKGGDAEKVVIADAMRIGAGQGFVHGGNGAPSGRPRWEEASVPYIEWVGAPDWLKVGDVSGRPLYAIYRGVDAYFALHTNAGGGTGTSTYTWYKDMWVSKSNWEAGFVENELPPGTDEWGTAIHDEIVKSIRAKWDSEWTNRGRKGANFGELRAFRHGWYEDKYTHGVADPLTVPAALVELAFHDKDYDARFIREMGFRKDAARAVHVAMIRHFKGADALVPPLAPVALHAKAVDGELVMSWEPEADSVYPNSDATSYRVYTSTDGLLFDPEPIETTDTTLSLPLDGCEAMYVRVTAVNDAGESLDSTVVGAKLAHEGGARVLYVDGVDREVKQVTDPNNPRSYARIYGPAIELAKSGVGFDMTSDEDAGRLIADEDYDLVIWAVGETSTRDETFALADQQVVAELLERGTKVLISGAEIGWDLVEKGDAADQEFFGTMLGAGFVGDDADTTEVDASALGLGTLTFGDCSADAACMEWPDVLEPESGGQAVLAYSAGAAAVESADGQTIVVGFPLETVADSTQRGELIAALAERLLGDAGNAAGACPDFGGGGEDAGGADAGGDDVGPGGPDAGGADAGADGSITGANFQSNDGCGCTSSGRDVPASVALLLLVGLGLGVARRD